MLAAFEDRYSSIVPFRNIVIVEAFGNLSIMCKFDYNNIRLEFVSKEIRDQQLANFKKWLTIPTNSI